MSDWAAKRFWSDVTVDLRGSDYVILLDKRLVKTPAKATLAVPSQAMAEAIAAEWEAQDEKIDPQKMPTTRSANAALDKVTPQRAEVAQLIAAYGENDLLCYRAPAPIELVDRQKEAWDPLLAWAAETLDAPLRTAEGVMHVAQPANAVANLTACVAAQSPFQLTALHDLVSMSGSLVIGLRHCDGPGSPVLLPVAREFPESSATSGLRFSPGDYRVRRSRAIVRKFVRSWDRCWRCVVQAR